MLRTDFIFAKCTKEGAPLPNILQIDFENDKLTTIEWIDEKKTSDLKFNLPCSFEKMDCRERTDDLWEIIALYESTNSYLKSCSSILKINIKDNEGVEREDNDNDDNELEAGQVYTEPAYTGPSNNDSDNDTGNDNDSDTGNDNGNDSGDYTADDLVKLYEEKHYLGCGHHYSTFLPDGLTDLGAQKGSNSRGCFVINGPDDIITFYTWTSSNSCVPNYLFNYKSGCELYTCAGPGNFKLLGSMKVDEFLKIAQYTGQKSICGGGNAKFSKRTDDISDEYKKIKSGE